MSNSITFWAVRSESRWEGAGNLGRGCYQTKPRWTQVPPDEATHFTWDAPSQAVVRCIGHLTHRYPMQRIEVLRPEVRKWAIGAVKKNHPDREGRTSISYTALTFKIVKDGHTRGIPGFLKQAMKAFALTVAENHDRGEWRDTYYPAIVRNLPVQPIYFEKSDFFEDLE